MKCSSTFHFNSCILTALVNYTNLILFHYLVEFSITLITEWLQHPTLPDKHTCKSVNRNFLDVINWHFWQTCNPAQIIILIIYYCFKSLKLKHHQSICKTFAWIALVEVVTLQKHINNNLKTSNNLLCLCFYNDHNHISHYSIPYTLTKTGDEKEGLEQSV